MIKYAILAQILQRTVNSYMHSTWININIISCVCVLHSE